MKYYTIHINDSGAVEYVKLKHSKGSQYLKCEMYDDTEFNQLNDLLHSTYDFIVNAKCVDILKRLNIIEYQLIPAKILRKEKIFGVIKKTRTYDYFQLSLADDPNLFTYDWIDFGRSEIILKKGYMDMGKLESHSMLLELIEENREISKNVRELRKMHLNDALKAEKLPEYQPNTWETKRVVFNGNFNNEIDLFRIPLYSWGTYVSENLVNIFKKENIRDVSFAKTKEELGIMWKPHYPQVCFEKSQ